MACGGVDCAKSQCPLVSLQYENTAHKARHPPWTRADDAMEIMPECCRGGFGSGLVWVAEDGKERERDKQCSEAVKCLLASSCLLLVAASLSRHLLLPSHRLGMRS